MLAGWLRMKYPATFQGALAASAPLVYFQGAKTAPEDGFSIIATDDFAQTYNDSRCSLGIKEGLGYLQAIGTADRSADWPAVDEIFNVCGDITDAKNVTDLIDMLQNGFLYMAMTDYPYPASFLEPMPAWPVNASCNAFADVAPLSKDSSSSSNLGDLSDRETLVLTALKAASDVYFNNSG